MSTITKTYFINAKIQYTGDDLQTVYHTVPCIVESDEDGTRRGLFVWSMRPEHDHLLMSNRKFQDQLYDTICIAVFGVGLNRFLENGLIKAPSGSVWDQHIDANKAYNLN